MWRHFHTLRFKLAGLYVVVFGVLLAALCGVVLTVSENILRENFDERLEDRAEAMADRIVVPAEGHGTGATTKPSTTRFNPFRFPGYYFQLCLADGRVVERSVNLGKETLPLTKRARMSRLTGAPVLETVRDEPAAALIGTEGGELRLVTLYHDRPGTDPFYLQVAVNLRRVNESVAQLWGLFLIVIPIGLLAAAVASWYLAHRYLAPIGDIARTAELLGAHNLTQRFEQPHGKTEIATMVSTINQMLDRLTAAFEAQERFVADVSHELKTPLSVLLGEAQVLRKRGRTAEEYQDFVTSVQDEVRAMGQMVDSLLALSRAEAGIPVTFTAEVSVNEAVIDAVERCRELAEQRQVRLVPHLAESATAEREPVVVGDGELLRLSVTNLLRNAVRYSPVQGAVEIKVVVTDGEAVISIRDHGPGIPAQYIDRIFDRFFRVPSKEGTFQGIGLGLTIVRGVARLHGGSVGVTNRPDGGCEFTLRLPLLRRE